MNKALYTILCILISFSGFSQLTNQWVDYNKSYYKFKVVADGVYRIDYATLQNAAQFAGLPLNSINRKDFQIFGRGQELYIHVEGAGPNSSPMVAGDYIEFYAEKNTGWLDASYYSYPEWHANPNVSLFTDTATYYLTWNNATPNRRLAPLANMNFTGKTTADYFMFESRVDQLSQPSNGRYVLSATTALYEPEFTEGQGWTGPTFTSSTHTVTIPTSNAYAAGPTAIATASVIGNNLQNHIVVVNVAGAGSTLNLSGIEVGKLNYAVTPANLGSPTTNFTFTAQQGSNDRNTVAFAAIEYPHTLSLGSASQMNMRIADAGIGDTAYLNFTNFDDQGEIVWLYDLSNNRRIAVGGTGVSHEVLVPNAGGDKQCFLFNEGQIISITALASVGLNNDGKFTDYSSMANDMAYLIVFNKKLRTSLAGIDYVEEYIAYRKSPNGGNHDVIGADIDELYDQFAFGIRKNPMAIRGFAEYALTWPTKPQNLFLLGKGVSFNKSRSTYGYYTRVLVPTYGWPSSDVLLTAGLDGTLFSPAIPTGRLAANSGEDVAEYLNKIIEFDRNQVEYQPDLDMDQLIELEEWKKQILHFAGGNGTEHTTFKGYLGSYEVLIEDSLFGGRIHQFNKNSSAPIQITASDSIRDLINGGVSIMTFFGHASGSGFDQNIDEPGVYQNTNGKYPLLIANSCLVGDIYQPTYTSNSETWIIHPRGTIAFLATVDFGEAPALHTYTREFYRNLGQKMYGQSIGAAVQQTIRDVELQFNLKKTCLLMALHGDPAVVLNTRSKPDYAIRVQDVYTTPRLVSTEIDSFDMHIIVTNLGRAINGEIEIKVTRTYPDASLAKPSWSISAYDIFYKDTFTVRLPVDLANGPGLNSFEVRVDNMDIVYELTEENNNILYPMLIQTEDIIPIYPYQFAIVPDKMQTLKASTGNPFAVDTIYRFQIDTTDAFSPPLAEYTTAQVGGVVEWNPTGTALEGIFSGAADSTVYFWRVRRDSLTPADINHKWRESSFQYIDGKRGWGQAHFHQFKNNEFALIDYNKPNRTFDFITTPKELWCQSVGNAWGTSEWLATEYRINGSSQIASSCNVPAAILVAVIDPLTLEPWISTSNPAPCYSKPLKCKIFQIADSTNQANLDGYLNSVPDSFYILAYTFRFGLVDSWQDTSLVSTFQSLGWNSITGAGSPGDSKPFIYFVKKGDLSSVKDTIGATSTSTIILTADLKTNYDYGNITTPNIGPAQEWLSLHWDMKTLEAGDSVSLEVSGINSEGNEVVISGLESLPPDSSDIYNLNTLIDDSIYSSIQLRIHKDDKTLKTAAQLRSWHVLLNDVPESALNPSIQLSFYNDSVKEGEIVSFSTVVQNISEYDMDSMLISYWILDKNREIQQLTSFRYKPLLKSPDTLLTGMTFSTEGLGGSNSLWVEVNPYVESKGTYDQLEKYHFNNLAELPFYAARDNTNPLLDVTFDGIHILDGDIVSAEPQIVIELKDENKFMALDTNSLLQVYLTAEDENQGTAVPYGGNTLRFIPASLPENKARVEFNPGALEDGIYELRVQATDVAKNESGKLDYLIAFEVINKPTVTSVMNWPNPFSTATKFVFTLTGTEIPQDFRIRILTVSGRVVREIFADELGPIHIGKNITEYAWDGRDEFGDQLANGVYLYKVDIHLNDAAMELRETTADQYFHKGYGKMYLLR